jgi:hypothetical protein
VRKIRPETLNRRCTMPEKRNIFKHTSFERRNGRT